MKNKKLLVVIGCAVIVGILLIVSRSGDGAAKNNLRSGELGSQAPLLLTFGKPLAASLPRVSLGQSTGFSLSLTDNDKTLVIVPSSTLTVGTKYTATISDIKFADGKTGQSQQLTFKAAFWPLSSYSSSELSSTLKPSSGSPANNPFADFLPYSTADFTLTYQYLPDAAGNSVPRIQFVTFTEDPGNLETDYSNAATYLKSKGVDIKSTPVHYSSSYLNQKYNTQNID